MLLSELGVAIKLELLAKRSKLSFRFRKLLFLEGESDSNVLRSENSLDVFSFDVSFLGESSSECLLKVKNEISFRDSCSFSSSSEVFISFFFLISSLTFLSRFVLGILDKSTMKPVLSIELKWIRFILDFYKLMPRQIQRNSSKNSKNENYS